MASPPGEIRKNGRVASVDTGQLQQCLDLINHAGYIIDAARHAESELHCARAMLCDFLGQEPPADNCRWPVPHLSGDPAGEASPASEAADLPHRFNSAPMLGDPHLEASPASSSRPPLRKAHTFTYDTMVAPMASSAEEPTSPTDAANAGDPDSEEMISPSSSTRPDKKPSMMKRRASMDLAHASMHHGHKEHHARHSSSSFKMLGAKLKHSIMHGEEAVLHAWHEFEHSLGVRFHFPVMHPASRIRVCWDMVGLSFIIYETYAIPCYIAFNMYPQGPLFFLVSVINVFFMIDPIATFFTGFRTEKGKLVMDPGEIAHRYVRGWFAVDVLAGIPWEWLQGWLPPTGKLGQLTRLLRLIRAFRLVRLLRQDFLTDNAKMFIDANPGLMFVMGILRITFVLFSITHWLACLWYIIGTRSSADETWVQAEDLTGESVEKQYLYSLYFTLTTMTTVGYGDITPKSFEEVCFVSVLLLIATVVFAALMGSLTDLIGSLNSEKNLQREKVLMLSRYMSWRHVPHDLFKAVRSHLLFLWETNRDYDAYEEEVKNQLPPVLRRELCYHIYGPILNDAPFLAWAIDFECVVQELANCVRQDIWSRGDSIFRTGMPNTHMYILLSGTVRISLNHNIYFGSENHADEPPVLGSVIPEDPSKPASTPRLLTKLADFVKYRVLKMEKPLDESEREFQENMVRNMALVRGGRRRVSFASSGLASSGSLVMTLKLHSADKKRNPGGSILEDAADKLRKQDMREKWAARFIQRKWKSKEENRKRSQEQEKLKPQAQKGIRTRSVSAPAYFGESCLWEPVDRWDIDAPPTYAYSARCQTRCQLVSLARTDVKDVIDKFSPWLVDRFEFFRHEVIKNAENAVHDGHHEESPSTAELAPASPSSAAVASGLQAADAARAGTDGRLEEVCFGATLGRRMSTHSQISDSADLESAGSGHHPNLSPHGHSLASGGSAVGSRFAELASRSKAEASRVLAGRPIDGRLRQHHWATLRDPLLH